MEPLLEVSGLSKWYDTTGRSGLGTLLGMSPRSRKQALRDISFSVSAGSAVGIVGRNGSGKSTLLRLVAGLAQPSSGSVHRRGSVGTLIDLGVGFHPDYSGRENLRFSAQLLGASAADLPALEASVAEFSGLGRALDEPLSTYSSGMAVRLGFSVATALSPDLLIVDEVLAVGDAGFQLRCYERMEQYIAAGGALLLVSHDMSSVVRMCDRALWIEAGALRMDGEPVDVARAYQDRIIEVEAKRHDRPEDAALLALIQPTGEARIESAEFDCGPGTEPGAWRSGAPARVRLGVDVRQPIESLTVTVTLYRDDGLVLSQAISALEGLELDALERGRVAVELHYPALAVAPCTAFVSVGLLPELDPRNDGPRRRFDLRSRAWKLVIRSGDVAASSGAAAYDVAPTWTAR